MLKQLQRLNGMMTAGASAGLSTMTCFYLFFCWAILPLLFSTTRDIVFYVSGGILQLVLLPLIAVNTKQESAKINERANQDHIALMEELNMHRQEMLKLDTIIDLLRTNGHAV